MPVETEETFGKRLKSLRLWRGSSVEELSRKVGIARSAIYKLENDERAPMWDTVVGLADALRVPLDAFRLESPMPVKLGRPPKVKDEA